MPQRIKLNSPTKAHKPETKLSRADKNTLREEINTYLEATFNKCSNIEILQDCKNAVKLAIKTIQEGMNEGGVANSKFFPTTNHYNNNGRDPLNTPQAHHCVF